MLEQKSNIYFFDSLTHRSVYYKTQQSEFYCFKNYWTFIPVKGIRVRYHQYKCIVKMKLNKTCNQKNASYFRPNVFPSQYLRDYQISRKKINYVRSKKREAPEVKGYDKSIIVYSKRKPQIWQSTRGKKIITQTFQNRFSKMIFFLENTVLCC